MGALIAFRDGLAKIYRNFDFAFKFILKGVFAFWCFYTLTNSLGYYDLLNIFSIRLFLSVVCAFLPPSFVVLIVALAAILHMIKLSMIFGIVTAVVLLIVYLVYLRFAPEQGIFMLAVACLAPFNLHFAVAFFLGLFFSPVTLIPVGLTLIVVQFIGSVQSAVASVGAELEIEKILSAYQSIINDMMGNRTMVLMIVTMAVIIVLTYVIKQLPFDYSWYVSIAVAAVVGIVIIVAGTAVLGVELSIGKSIIGIVIGAVLGLICQFLSCIVDYPKKQRVQFEDDDYYYYVKAIPKIGNSSYDEDDAEDEYMSDDVPSGARDDDQPVDDEDFFADLAQKRRQEQDAEAQAPAQELPFDEGAFDNFDFFTDDDNNLF